MIGGLNGYAGGTNWAGIADKIGTQYFLIRLPFRRVGELIDAGVGGLRDIESFETWGSKSFRIRGVGTSRVLEAVNDFVDVGCTLFLLVVELDH